MISDASPPPRPEITVWLVSYNAAAFIERALHSILDQVTQSNIEILVYDDASTDSSVDIARRILVESSARWSILSMPSNRFSRGLSPVPLLLRESSGEFIARLDADDFWTEPTKIELQVALLRAHPRVNLCCTGFVETDETGDRVLAAYPDAITRGLSPIVQPDHLANGNFICHSSTLVRTSALRALNLPESWEALTVRDYPLWVLLSRPGGIGVLPDQMVGYRRHSSNSWASKPLAQRQIDEIEAVLWIADHAQHPAVRARWIHRAGALASNAVHLAHGDAHRTERLLGDAETTITALHTQLAETQLRHREDERAHLKEATEIDGERARLANELAAVTQTRGYRVFLSLRRLRRGSPRGHA